MIGSVYVPPGAVVTTLSVIVDDHAPGPAVYDEKLAATHPGQWRHGGPLHSACHEQRGAGRAHPHRQRRHLIPRLELSRPLHYAPAGGSVAPFPQNGGGQPTMKASWDCIASRVATERYSAGRPIFGRSAPGRGLSLSALIDLPQIAFALVCAHIGVSLLGLLSGGVFVILYPEIAWP